MHLRAVERSNRAAVRAGFTLMELLVVVAILLVLVSVATPIYLNYLEKSKRDAAVGGATILAGALSTFATAHANEPEFSLTRGYPSPESRWDYLLLDGIIKEKDTYDPWQRQFEWTFDETGSPVVISAGPDGQHGTADDLINR